MTRERNMWEGNWITHMLPIMIIPPASSYKQIGLTCSYSRTFVFICVYQKIHNLDRIYIEICTVLSMSNMKIKKSNLLIVIIINFCYTYEINIDNNRMKPFWYDRWTEVQYDKFYLSINHWHKLLNLTILLTFQCY